MSLIFKALEKLQDPAARPQRVTPGSPPPRPIYVFPKRCFQWIEQHKGWLGGALAIVAVSVYAVQHYMGLFPASVNGPASFQQSTVLSRQANQPRSSRATSVKMGGENQAQGFALPSAVASESPPPPVMKAPSQAFRYMAPSSASTTLPAALNVTVAAPPAKEPEVQSKPPQEPTTTIPEAFRTPPAATANETLTSGPMDYTGAAPLPQVSDDDWRNAAIAESSLDEQNLPNLAALDVTHDRIAASDAKTLDTLDDIPQNRLQRFGILAQSNRQADIARLVDQIQRQISLGNYQGADQLLSQLAEIKGPEDSYVLKLKAVSEMHLKAYASAATLLEKVLARDATDLDAGLNMAIIEVNTGRVTAARERLHKLLEVYPDEPRIESLVQRLP